MRFKNDTENWRQNLLSEISTSTGGGTPSTKIKEYWKGNIGWISSSDLQDDNVSQISVTRFISNDAIINSSTKICPPNTIHIVSRVGVGKVAISKESLCTSQDFVNLIDYKLKPLFLTYQLQCKIKEMIKSTQGTSIKGLTTKEINLIKMSYPNKDVQEKIANFLSLIDKRINTQNKIIEDLDTLKNSIMDQLLMRDIFDEISIKDFINQGYARIIKASEMKKFSGEKLYLSTSSIDKNGIFKIECKITYNDRPSRASMIPIKNSVWFAKMKDSIKVYKSENDDESKYILSTGFYGILCNEDVVNPDWMVEIFKSNYFNNQKDRFSEGSSMSGIKENQLEDIKVKLFKNKNLEKKYCLLFYILNKKLNVETDYLEKLKEQKKYLLSNMFI